MIFRNKLFSAAKSIALGLLLLAGGICSAANAGKIAVVDLERVFREYYKSKIAEESIRQQADAYRNYLNQLNNELQQLERALRTARSNALNIALSAAEKEKANADAQEKQRAFSAKQAEIKLYIEERSADMRRMENAKRQEIMKEIRNELKKSAAASGFEFVFDTSGRTMNDQPAILVYPENSDITNRVIRELNRTRPQRK